MEEYYTYVHGEVKGPYTLAELKELEITPKTRIGSKNADGDITYKQAGQIDDLSELFVEPIPAKNEKLVEKTTPKPQKPVEERGPSIKPLPQPIEPTPRQAVVDKNIEMTPISSQRRWINYFLVAFIVFLVGLVAYWERDKIVKWLGRDSKVENTNTGSIPLEDEKKQLSSDAPEESEKSGLPKNSPEKLVVQKRYNALALQADNALRSGNFKLALDKMSEAAMIRREQSERGSSITISGKAKEMYDDLTADARDILVKTETLQLGDEVNLRIAKDYLLLAIKIDDREAAKLQNDIKECERRIEEAKRRFK